jgi:glutamate synthase (NADPH) large chain
MYHPFYEHDACGVGFVANIDGKRTHKIIRQGIQVLENLEHRGACGCDPETGDGAGMILQTPHEFFQREADRLGFDLPAEGAYAAGMIFLPDGAEDRAACERLIESVVTDEGQEILGWRDVPHDPEAIG